MGHAVANIHVTVSIPWAMPLLPLVGVPLWMVLLMPLAGVPLWVVPLTPLVGT